MMNLGHKAIAQRRDQAERLLQQGNVGAAEHLLRMVTAADKSDPRAWDLLGTAYFKRGKTGDAVSAFRRSLALRPFDADRHYRLAMLLRQTGRNDEARALLRKSLQLRPDFPEARDALARLGEHPPGNGPSQSAPNQQQPSVLSGPGRLQYEGHRLIRSYFAPLAVALIVGLAGFLLSGSERLPTHWLSDYVAGVPQARAHLQTVTSLGEDNPFVVDARRDLQNAKLDAIWWEDVFADLESLAALGLIVLATLLALRALFGAALTQYRVYERRIDIRQGVLRRTVNSIWLYEITDVTYRQPLSLLLGGTARLVVMTDRGTHRVTGLESGRKMEALWEEIRDAVLVQRREIKGIWV